MTVTLCMLVKNAAAVITRALDSAAPAFSELSLVVDSSTDGTADVAADWCRKNQIVSIITEISPASHPHLYRYDVPSSYLPYEGVPFPGPFSGTMMLADFAAARNIGWDAAGGDWLMTLDCDDVVKLSEPVEVASNIYLAELTKADQIFCHHQVSGTPGSRLCRFLARRGSVRWTGKIHEQIASSPIERLAGTVNVVDMKDCPGEKIPRHYYKVAYLTCQEAGWDRVDVSELGNLVMDMAFSDHPRWRQVVDFFNHRAEGTGLEKYVKRTIERHLALVKTP